MAIPTDVNISGYKELIAQFDKLSKVADTGEMEGKLLNRARELRNDIRKNAPRSNKWSGSVDVKPGNLRRAVEARKFRKKVPNSPAVYVRSNRKKAPHAHLVEYGTMNFRFPKHKKVLHFIYEGEEVFVKKVAPMPPHPYFRPTVDLKQGEIESGIARDAEELIMKISNEK